MAENSGGNEDVVEDETPKPAETAEESPQPAATVSLEDVRRLQSSLQGQINEAKEAANAADKRADAATRRAESAELAGIDDPEERDTKAREYSEGRHEAEVDRLKREAEEAKGLAEDVSRVAVAERLAAKYDLDAGLLMDSRTVQGMEGVAKAIRTAKNTAKPEPKAEEEAKEPEFDSGVGGGGSTPYDGKKYEGTGDVFESLKAKRAAGS